MKILLLYISPNRTTHKISRVLRDHLSQAGHSVTLLDIGRQAKCIPQDLLPHLPESVDLVGIGSPVYHMRMLAPMQANLSFVLSHLRQPLKAFLYLTYGGITTGKALLLASEILERYKVPVVGAVKIWAPHFYHRVAYPDPAALQTAEAFCQRLEESQFQAIPSDQLRGLFSYQTWKVKAIFPLTHWISKVRRLPIRIDAAKCTQCQRCVNECPTGAMELGETVIYNRQQCIFCYHCTTVCRQQAVLCPTEKVEEMLQVNKKIIGCEQPTNAVYFS